MKPYFFLGIPIIVGILVGYYLFINTTDNQNDFGSDALLTVTKLTQDGSPMIGDPSAEITILEWGDYQCTFCFRFHASSLEIIKQEYIDTGKVNLVFKDFPLNGPDSILAAEASYCADDQGKYWEYHDQLYTNWGGERTGWITRDSLNKFANNVELDITQFNQCLDEHKYNLRVLQLEQFGKDIGIDATPSFLIFNDEKIIKIRGNQPIDAFRQAIDDL